MKDLFIVIFLSLLTSVPAVGNHSNDITPKEKPVFIHSVYFWLKDSVTDAQRKEFMDLLRSFRKIKSVSKVFVASPAGTKRTVVDNTYDVALIVMLKDKAAHDHYQADQIHRDAIKIFEGWIQDIRIYDSVTTRGTEMIYE